MSPDVRREVRVGADLVVRAVKRGDTLTSPGFRAEWDDPEGWLVAPVLDAVTRPLYRRVRTWQVGVLRRRRSFGKDRWLLLHREVLARDEDPTAALDRLAAEARAGRYPGAEST